MLVKIFSNKGGGSAGASLDYLLDKPDGTMQVLEGNPTLSRKIAESLKFATPYTVGALSFEERNLDDSQKREIMAKFESAIFAGLDKEQYNISWIEHTDKGRLELNFFIPNVELTTGKRLQPYYDKADRPLVENFKQVINHEYGLSDPNAPEKKQLMISRQDLPKDKQGALNAIQDGLIALAKQGRINDRQDIINALESSGFEIARVTDKSISIKTEGQNLRLKGAFYEKDFRIGDSLSETIRERAEQYQRTSAERYHTARDKLERAVEYRERQFQEKYPNRTAELDRAHEKLFKIPFVVGMILISIFGGVLGLMIWQAEQQYSEMNQWKASAELWKTQSNGMKLQQCLTNKEEQEVKLCIAIDPNYKDKMWGAENGEILKIVKMEDYQKKTNNKEKSSSK